MYHYKLIITLLLSSWLASCASQVSHTDKNETLKMTAQAVDCQDDTRYSWQTTSLASYIDICTPTGWEAFFAQPEVKKHISHISSQFELQLENPEYDDINPKLTWVFRAMQFVEPDEMKSFLIGQDPAPQRGQATGLAFSLKPGTSSGVTPSVQRVLLEAQNEGACINLDNATLQPWAEQGVFLWNVAPTIPCKVDDNYCTIRAHVDIWEDFSHHLVEYVETLNQPLTYIMWGSAAGKYSDLINNEKHKAIKGQHPSPRNETGKFFCKTYFSGTNQWLSQFSDSSVDGSVIDWNLANVCEPQPACVYEWDSETRTSSCERDCPQ